MIRMRPASWLAGLAFLSACTASWHSIVRYSDVPAPAGVDAEEGVYGATLAHILEAGVDSAIYQRHLTQEPPADATRWADSQVPPFWVDTLKRELHHALTAQTLWMEADSVQITEAAAARHVVLVWPRGEDTLAALLRRQVADKRYRFTPIIHLSRPGFNADSTVATIRVDVICGGLCGAGQTLYLARRAGHVWRVWGGHTNWVS